MTIDDSSSVYVGGLSYDTTEDAMRKAFEEYGEIKAVKHHEVVLDPEGQSRGYGFVTFSNPRAAADAIRRMDGKAIDGRTVKVDEVKNKTSRVPGRDFHGRDRENRDRENRMNRNRDRNGRGRRFSPVGNRRPSPRNFRSSRGHSPVRRRSRSPRKGRSHSGSQHVQHSQSPLSPGSSDGLRYSDEPTSAPKVGGRIIKDKSLDRLKLKEELERSLQKSQELQEQISLLERDMDHADQHIADLQSAGQRLEESLASAQAAASHRRNQLRKLQQAVLDVKDCKERLKHSETELENVIAMASAMMEGGDVENNHEGNGGKYDDDRANDGYQSPKEGN